MEIQLKFDMRDIKDDKVVVLIGKRDTGKSFLCKDILYHHRNIPVGQVISAQRVLINSIVKWFQNYLFTVNLIHRLFKILLKDKKYYR